MRLVYPNYQLEVFLHENQITVLSIENPEVYSAMLHDMWNQTQGNIGGFILSDGDKIRNVSKEMECIFNPFTLDCNDKKIINKLYQELKANADTCLISEGIELNQSIIKYLDQLLLKVPYALDYNIDFDVLSILKAYSVKLECFYSNLLERIIEYLKVMNRICNIHIFVFVDLKHFLTENELVQLYEFVFYEKISLIIIEPDHSKRVSGEKCWLLDEDLCIIEM